MPTAIPTGKKARARLYQRAADRKFDQERYQALKAGEPVPERRTKAGERVILPERYAVRSGPERLGHGPTD